MGADQIGYLIFLPAGKEASVLVKKTVSKFEKMFDAVEEARLLKHHELRQMNPRWTAEEADEKSEEFAITETLKGLDKLGIDRKYLGENACLDDDESVVEFVKSAVEALSSFKTTDLGYRDTCVRRDKLNGRDVIVAFAGGMSWGDEPDGGGYTAFKALDTLGLIGPLEDMALGKQRRKP
jgi:hypothetical protein